MAIFEIEKKLVQKRILHSKQSQQIPSQPGAQQQQQQQKLIHHPKPQQKRRMRHGP